MVLSGRDEWFAVLIVYELNDIRSQRKISGNDLPQNSAPRNKSLTICESMESLGFLIFILRKKRRKFRDHVRRLIKRRPPNMRLSLAEFIVDRSMDPFVDRRMDGVNHATPAV